MLCEACERGDHHECGMQTWCECDCDGPEGIDFGGRQEAGDPNDVVGHKTFDTGEIDPETGFPKLRHEPLTRAEADVLWEASEKHRKERSERMPDEQAALKAMFDAFDRLRELGWREGKYCPKDGSRFRVIELGSTGIFDGDCTGTWPDCTWTTYDGFEAFPSSQAPALFKLSPEDQAAYDARMAEAAARYMGENRIGMRTTLLRIKAMETKAEEKRRNKKDAILIAFSNKKISIRQVQAQLKDLGYEQWEIDLFLDGDIDIEGCIR